MTAEEFLINKSRSKDQNTVLSSLNDGEFTTQMMVQFAKLKVQEALRETANKYKAVNEESASVMNYNLILGAYNLNNIK